MFRFVQKLSIKWKIVSLATAASAALVAVVIVLLLTMQSTMLNNIMRETASACTEFERVASSSSESIQGEQVKAAQQALQQKAEGFSNLVAELSATAIASFDFSSMNDYCSEVCRDEDISFACVVGQDGTPLTTYLNDSDERLRSLVGSDNKLTIKAVCVRIENSQGLIFSGTDVIGAEDNVIGKVIVLADTAWVEDQKRAIESQFAELIGELRSGSLDLQETISQAAVSGRRKIVSRGTIAGFAGLALLVVSLTFLVTISTTKPLAIVIHLAERVGKGDMSKRLNWDRGDELGVLARALDNAVGALAEKAELAAGIAGGDLTRDVTLASDKDGLGKALQLMNSNLSEMVGNIRQSAAEINAGSTQISDSSQSLSQGSTEQAASLEEISSSMTEVDGQARQNAKDAGQANEMVLSTSGAAVKGTEQMKKMRASMTRISEASESISKIIKTIDDIAFQTNLLALNAAVEAARAGKQGKGFAVVAEEVRSLAGRSAKAAQETSELIKQALDAVRGGEEIAAKTAESLVGIVESVTQAAEVVDRIATASNEQAHGVAEVNEGLRQVDNVVQQSVASAEELASAAGILSSQGERLDHLLRKFELAEAGAAEEYATISPDQYSGYGSESELKREPISV